MIDEVVIARRFADVGPEFNERQRRLWAAAEARALGYGGVAAVSRATGISEDTIGRGKKELAAGARLEAGRVRREGAGRPRLTVVDPTPLEDLERLVDPGPRRAWGSSRARLGQAGHQISDWSTGKLLRSLGFRLHANRKTREGAGHPDRDAQFIHINETTRAALAAGEPTISIDAKKRELVGDFKAVGRE